MTNRTWVEIERVILNSGERAPQIPEDTRSLPYVMKVSGFLAGEAENVKPGDEVTITTMIGRTLMGKLVRLNPGYSHSFGDTIPELLEIGLQS